MTVRLLLTCLADAFLGEVGIATVRVLEHAGCRVVFDEGQTCCGQPAFNMGDWAAARVVGRRCLEVLGSEVPVVVPSTSCAAMLGHGYELLGLNSEPPRLAKQGEGAGGEGDLGLTDSEPPRPFQGERGQGVRGEGSVFLGSSHEGALPPLGEVRRSREGGSEDFSAALSAASATSPGELPPHPRSSSDPSPPFGRRGIQAFELTHFLVHELGITHWPLKSGSPGKKQTVVLHRSCHGRMLGTGSDAAQQLLKTIPGLTLLEPRDPDQCCGFGGSFSATHTGLSESIGLEKLRHLQETGASVVTALDGGCLLHLKTLAERNGIRLQFKHVSQILAEALP